MVGEGEMEDVALPVAVMEGVTLPVAVMEGETETVGGAAVEKGPDLEGEAAIDALREPVALREAEEDTEPVTAAVLDAVLVPDPLTEVDRVGEAALDGLTEGVEATV